MASKRREPPPNKEEILKRLRKSLFFENWDSRSLGFIADKAYFKTLDRGEPVWQEGENGSFAFVWRNYVEVYKWERGRGEVVLDHMQPGTVLGLSALVGRAHTAHVRAPDGADILMWDARYLHERLSNDAALAMQALESATRLVGKLNAELALHRRDADVTEHVRFWLNQQLDQDKHTGQTQEDERKSVTVEIIQDHLARRLGYSKNQVNRALGTLKEAGIIRVRRGAIEISPSEEKK